MTATTWACPACGRDDLTSPHHVCTEDVPVTTMHTRDAEQVDEYLCDRVPVRATGNATIVDDGDTATVTYLARATITHEQMLDLLEETS